MLNRLVVAFLAGSLLAGMAVTHGAAAGFGMGMAGGTNYGQSTLGNDIQQPVHSGRQAKHKRIRRAH
jgi:hypothetical protein